jgi:SAM-dependent methyltransferase
MEHPPICNYEGSDYQTSFWEKGGRAYEDAVEAIALGRLLPSKGVHLLELGAGAGRNTHRYDAYDRVTLLDYSRSQLEQARERLGAQNRYRFIAADIYRLPFVPAVFDGATMIRTLHHMREPAQALEQVRQVLQIGAVFILEYANKQNLKAILRYLIGHQKWSPFSSDAVEFAPLNFDFHPSMVHRWLRDSGFIPQKSLAVSYFRIGLLKRNLPLRLLVKMDSLLQPTGNLFVYSPSVFVRSIVSGQAITVNENTFFACPSCKTPLDDTPPELRCSCGQVYRMEDGIYDFRLA